MSLPIQVTLISDKGYKPVSCIVDVPSVEYFNNNRKEVIKKGIVKICQKRYWKSADLKKYGYGHPKTRLYDKEKIAKKNAERYAKIKAEKFASGEWTPSRKDIENGYC